ncbi:MAG: hypothetical protein JW708_07750, partial [Vallitaleaceae bacterium]|nr:hypothetical protein [Vallitaleaceae bacterium]
IFAQIPCVIHFQKQIGGAVGQKAIISEILSGENLATATPIESPKAQEAFVSRKGLEQLKNEQGEVHLWVMLQ